MIFSNSNDGIGWSLHFGPISDTLTVQDLVQEFTISSQEVPLALELVVVSKTRLSERPSSECSNYSKPGTNYGDEGRSTFKSRRTTKYGHKRVSSV